MSVAREGTRGGLPRAEARRAARAVLRGTRHGVRSLSITFVSDAAMRRLNRRHLDRRGLTDVIAFALRADGGIVGDVYVAPGAARSAAAAQKVGVREELTRLVVHGTLHVAGWDHPDGAGRTRSPMWLRQEAIVAKLLGTRR